MKALVLAALAAAGLAACTPDVPAGGPSYFDEVDPLTARRDLLRREALAEARALGAMSAAATPVATIPGTPGIAGVTEEDEIAAEVMATLGVAPGLPGTGVRPDPATGEGAIDLTRNDPNFSTAPLANPADASTISDSQNFQTVIQRETIESDAERLARQREARVVVSPEDVQIEAGGATTGPSPTEFALATTHQVGEKTYRRSGLASASKAAAECAKYASVDSAQRAFLEAGGPDRDRKGMDPDGDGFVCGWSPTTYRQAAGRG